MHTFLYKTLMDIQIYNSAQQTTLIIAFNNSLFIAMLLFHFAYRPLPLLLGKMIWRGAGLLNS
jgi:hypothetical protein